MKDNWTRHKKGMRSDEKRKLNIFDSISEVKPSKYISISE